MERDWAVVCGSRTNLSKLGEYPISRHKGPVNDKQEFDAGCYGDSTKMNEIRKIVYLYHLFIKTEPTKRTYNGDIRCLLVLIVKLNFR